MKRKFKAFISSMLVLSFILSVTACGDSSAPVSNDASETTTTEATTERTTFAVNEGVVSEVENLVEQVKDETIEVTKKIKWLAWYEIVETSAAVELFKKVYGIPEQGSADYPEIEADNVFTFQNVAYAQRYPTLSTLVQSGDSPDIFPFEIQNFPYSVYQNLFQSIDGIVDTTTEAWADTRSAMDRFMWGGKNYCPITSVNTFSLLWYRKSIIEEAGLDDPYDLYKAGNWTWDTFLEMCEKFSSPEEGKYCLDGWNPENSFIGTTGVPLIDIKDGILVENLYSPNIERCMDLLTKLCVQDYRYPRHTLNNYSLNYGAWANGDTLFFDDGTWAFEEKWRKYRDKYGWADDEVCLISFPRDPNSDKYYQMQKQDAFMLVAGAKNIDGYKAWIDINLACSKDANVIQASREQKKADYGWTDTQLDLIDEIATLAPVFDFKNGIGEDISGTGSSENAIERLTKDVYVQGLSSYTQLRAEGEGEIRDRINVLNATA